MKTFLIENWFFIGFNLFLLMSVVIVYLRSCMTSKKEEEYEKAIDLRFSNACIVGMMQSYGISREQAEIRFRWQSPCDTVSDAEKESHEKYMAQKHLEMCKDEVAH
jgi:hypothetical protein